jgi:Flp pilus assembly pilin Flp
MRHRHPQWQKPLRSLTSGQRGATAVEYALLLAGITAVIVAAVVAFGLQVNGLYGVAVSALP